MSYRKRNILAAAGLAIIAIVFMLAYISKAHSGGTAKGSGPVAVLVATHDIKAGTPGSALQRGAFAARKVPANAAVSDAVPSPASVRGERVTQEIFAGQQVSQRQFGPAGASGVRSQLRGQERVVQLEGDPSQVLDGTLHSGDHVDILGTWNTPENCGQCHVSRTIVRNALVLRTSADLGKPGPSSSQTVPVQLRLTDSQAERVFWMVKNGQWWLELRPVLHPRSAQQGYDNSRTILQDGLQRRGASR
jgi:Flp pilus assembly protein CpaB